MREHRLYQADWLMRFYGFAQDEICTDDGMLSLDVDPKLAWALANPAQFPIDLNQAPKERLLRVPGLGVRSVERLLLARRDAQRAARRPRSAAGAGRQGAAVRRRCPITCRATATARRCAPGARAHGARPARAGRQSDLFA